MKSPKDARTALSILLVEDDQAAGEYLARLIPKKFPGCVIHLAENGQRGVELFREYRPDIVITDINMPIMDGIEMAEKIRALDPGAQIIAATAKSEPNYLLNAIKIGINRYVLKPIDIEKLFESMMDCIDRITLKRQVAAQNDFIRKLSLAVEQSTDMMVIANARGAIEYVNPRFTGITGYTAGEVTGQNLRILLSNQTPDDSEILWSTVTRGLRWQGEFLFRKKGGDTFCVQASISPLSAAEGNTTHFVAVLQDISERREAEQHIRSLNEELEQRVKKRTLELETSNRELETFCYSVSHDLRAPLRSMSGFCHILQEDYSDKLDKNGKECLQRVHSAAVRMGQLIDNLLNLSRVTRSMLCLEKVDLSAMADQIVQSLDQQEPERRVEVVVPEGIEAHGDPLLVRLVLENLLGNAWKYTGKEPNPRIEFGTSSSDGKSVYFVRDNGIGFDMAYLSKLFVPFQRLHGMGEFEGTGIGLASVERIVTRHGGRVWAEAQLEKGATFYFTLG